MTAHIPTKRDVAQLFDADQHIRHLRNWWVLIWIGNRWLLVYDPPSPPRPEIGR